MTPLDPQAIAVIRYLAELAHPSLDKVPAAEARRLYRETRAALRPPAPALPVVGDLNAEGTAGSIPLRLYRPSNGVLPALIYFHGGGWVRWRSGHARCRLPPDRPRRPASSSSPSTIALPRSIPFLPRSTTAASATTWIASNAVALGIDNRRLAVGGDSAGGGLAAVMTLMARTRRPRADVSDPGLSRDRSARRKRVVFEVRRRLSAHAQHDAVVHRAIRADA